MPTTNLSISGLVFSLDTPEPLLVQGEFTDFLTVRSGVPALNVHYAKVQTISVPLGPPLANTGAFSVYWEDGSFVRFYSTNSGVTALSRRTLEGAEVRYLEDSSYCRTIRDCFTTFPLEELLLAYGRMILHASCVETDMGGILFSGPSGIGKSTQADLWHQFCGARILNGDRVILHRTAMGWMASGSPYAGSSQVYVNRSVPVRAVVMLEQGSGNELTPLPQPEAFRLIYPQLLINTWNPQFVERVCDLCQGLIDDIPVVRFSCTPDQTAVQALDTWLKGGGVSG